MKRSDDAPASSAQARPVLQADDLRKSYGARPALRGLSFSLQAGRILGFLGPNGAGKTTAIRILTTILEPSSGHFVVDGIGSDDPESIRHRIGVLPESLGFPKHVTGMECLTYFGRLYGRPAADARRIAESLLEDVGLAHRARSLVGTYSRGMRQRLGIARALINDPAVVFLDEPTLGLDPRGQQDLLALVGWIARQRHAGVVLCSHLLTEVESTCDDVVILNSGQVVAAGTVSDVIRGTRGAGTRRNSIRIHVPPPSVAAARQILLSLPTVRAVAAGSGGQGWLAVEVVAPADSTAAQDTPVTNAVLNALIRASIPVLSVEEEGGRLQDVFLHLTEAAHA